MRLSLDEVLALSPSNPIRKAYEASLRKPATKEVGEKPAGRSHYNARPTDCARGHRHASKVEARVCASVYAEAKKDTFPEAPRVFRNARLPLWALPPTDAGLPHYCNVDFVIYAPAGGIVRIIDAKSGKRSRDWERGRAAVEATYGVKVEERS